jgi:hypothetical protein
MPFFPVASTFVSFSYSLPYSLELQLPFQGPGTMDYDLVGEVYRTRILQHTRMEECPYITNRAILFWSSSGGILDSVCTTKGLRRAHEKHEQSYPQPPLHICNGAVFEQLTILLTAIGNVKQAVRLAARINLRTLALRIQHSGKENAVDKKNSFSVIKKMDR